MQNTGVHIVSGRGSWDQRSRVHSSRDRSHWRRSAVMYPRVVYRSLRQGIHSTLLPSSSCPITMLAQRARLSLEALSAWMSFNDAALHGVNVQSVENKGNGLVAQEKLARGSKQTPLLAISHGLVLNQEAVEEYAKEDRNFRELLDTCGHKVSVAATGTDQRLLAECHSRVLVMTYCCFCWSNWSCPHSQRSA